MLEAHLHEESDGWAASDADGRPLRGSSISMAMGMLEHWFRENPDARLVLHRTDGAVEVYTGAEDDPRPYTRK